MNTTIRGSMVATEATRRQNQRCDAVVEAFRVARGIERPETARQHLLRLPGEMCSAIHAFRVHGTPERYQRFVEPVRFALDVRTAPRFSSELVLADRNADAAEDVSETAFLLHPCHETAAAHVRKLDAEIAAASALRCAIVDRFLS